MARKASSKTNDNINKKLIEFLSNYQLKHAAGYIAMREEADILPSLYHFFQLNINIYMPCIYKKHHALIFKPWTPDVQLIHNLYGTLEPNTKANCSLINKELDFIFIPCVGVFRQKSSIYRIGYGGGFYDRTIAELKKVNSKFKTIGIFHTSYIPTSEQINIYATQYDMPLDYIICP